jgi:cell division protein FtsL
MKKPVSIIVLLGFIIVVLLVVRISFVNSISTTGIALVDLQNQISDYKKENELLTVQYLQAASYTNISNKAEQLGYAPVKSQVDLAAPLPMAMR